MEELYRVANEYYTKLESFKAYGAFKNIYFLFVLVSTLLFVFSAVFLLREILVLKNTSIFSQWFILTIGSEFLMFISVNKLREKKEKQIIKNIEAETGKFCKTIEDAKVELLKSYFSCDQLEFSDLAEKIQSMLNRARQYSNEKSQIEKIFNFIYNKEANPRILTLFVLLCSIITILSVNAGQNLNTMIVSFSESDMGTLATLYSFILIIVLVLGFGATQFFNIAQGMLIFISLFFLRESAKNIETVKYLIRDLNNYHIFKKTQDKKIIIEVKKT